MFPTADIWDAMDTNLRAFRAHAGKLIMWQGWADNGIPPSGTVDYYDTLASRMGGLSSTEQFARLFMLPSVYHCGGSYAGATVPDMIYPRVQWVENATAPSQLTASCRVGSASFSRPVYPYPDIPRYNGSGPTSDATSFHPGRRARGALHRLARELPVLPADRRRSRGGVCAARLTRYANSSRARSR
jgi:feruloyl esterase